MYNCQITGNQSKPGEKLNRLVVATRARTYTKWVRNEETNKWEEVFLSTGTEIVREINACHEGVDLWKSWTPEEQARFLQHMQSQERIIVVDITNSDIQAWILTKASADDLHLIQEVIRTKQSIQFHLGDTVWFDAKTRGIVHGKITKMNAKTIKVTTSDGMKWTVGPALLHKDFQHEKV